MVEEGGKGALGSVRFRVAKGWVCRERVGDSEGTRVLFESDVRLG